MPCDSSDQGVLLLFQWYDILQLFLHVQVALWRSHNNCPKWGVTKGNHMNDDVAEVNDYQHVTHHQHHNDQLSAYTV